MADPQIENGFCMLPNELLEAIARIRIPGESMQVFLVIIRKTYGFHKHEDRISLSQFNLSTGLAKSSIIRALRILISMNLIYKKVNGTVSTYRILKDY